MENIDVMEINGITRTIGLIGNPVEHTLSPVIHNGISSYMEINSTYLPFKVEMKGVEAAIRGAYELNILGMNVTVPHKNKVIDFLVDIDDCAKHIGAVNTLVRDENRHGYKGYNTDMPGLKRQLEEDGIKLQGRTIVVLGAGGVSKAVIYMCLLEGASKIYLLNRTLSKAEELADYMNGLVENGYFDKCNENSAVIPLSLSDYNKIEEDSLIAFQATSIGLYPNVDDVVIDDGMLYDKIEIGIDLIYNPANTKFMQLVAGHGGKSYNALKMLLYQGVIAYELWHNVKVPEDVIKDVLVELKRNVYKKNNIVLIGFMGSGKTTVGKELAKELSMDFIDTDNYIIEHEKMSIPDIFKERGEDEFRRIETKTLEQLRDSLDNTIISTGGGMPLRQENARLLKEIGKVMYLKASNSVIYNRVKDDNNRPLLAVPDPYQKICDLMKERQPKYIKACDCVIDTDSNDIEYVKDLIKKNCGNSFLG